MEFYTQLSVDHKVDNLPFLKGNIHVKVLTEESALDLYDMFTFLPSHFINSQGLRVLLPRCL